MSNMSGTGFDDNPFGEPMVDNPFADPAIQHARTTTAIQNTLDDYNPFEDPKPNAQPAAYQPPNVPSYNQNVQTNAAVAQTQITTAELQRRQEELERKAEELERRERDLRNNAEGIRRNNWPPLPEKCCFQPCFYQDINVEIPSEFQKTVRQLYRLWLLYAGILCANIIGAMILMFHDGQFITFGLAIFYGFIFTPASFMCWYRPAYKAFRNDSSFNFMVFFFIFFFQMILLVIQTIGIPNSGYCGFVTALGQFDGTPGGIFVGIIILFIAMAFATCATGNFVLLTKIHAIYRKSETVSLNKAQAEFTTEFMRNQNVQRAAADVVSAQVRNAGSRY